MMPQIARHIEAGVPNLSLLFHVRVACAARHARITDYGESPRDRIQAGELYH